MDYSLKEHLNFYKDTTKQIIDNLNSDSFDDIAEAINKRQNILDSIGKLKYTKEEINSICEELQIFEIDKKVNDLIKSKQEQLKDNIQKDHTIKNANNTYHKNLYSKAMIFSKKI